MAHLYEGKPDGRQASGPIETSRFRPAYRQLSDAEKGLHDLIKVRATDIEALINQITPCRETSLAMTKLEEAVMWAVKGLTGPAGMRMIHTDPAAAYDAYSVAGCRVPSAGTKEE